MAEYPTFNTQGVPLQNGAIPTYPTQSVAPLSSNPLNTYSQVVGTEQALQNMRNQSQQMKRDQISFQEQQHASREQQKGLLKPGTADFDRYNATMGQGPGGDGLLPGEQQHQNFLQGITQALAHGMHAISGLVHGGGQGGTNPSGIPAPQATAPGTAAPNTNYPTDQQAALAQGPPASFEKGGVVGHPTHAPAPAKKLPFLENPPVSVEASQTPASTIVGYDQGGPVLNTFAASGAGVQPPGQAGNSGTGNGAGGATALNTFMSGAGGGAGGAGSAAGGAGATAGEAASGAGAAGAAGALAFFQNGGAVPSPSPAFGIHDGGVSGIRGYAAGGEVAQQGPPAPVAAPQAAAQQHFVQAAEASAAHLHSLALDDSGQPGNAGGIPATGPVPIPGVNAPDAPASSTPQAAQTPPTQGTMPPPQAGAATPQGASGSAPAASQPTPNQVTGTKGVLTAAATDSVALGGKITTTPGAENKPKSISMDDWARSDELINRASMAAAAAGHDGAAVADSLNANRNAWVQGHVLRWLSVANTQAQANNQKGVMDAMKNAYYYIPNGQDLQIQKNAQGQVVFQDMIDPPGPDGKPLMRPVTPATLQQMGTALLDPMNLNNLIMGARSAQAKIGLEQSQAQAAMLTGEGNFRKGTGIQATGESHLQRVTNENWRDLATGEAELMRATAVRNHLTNIVKQNKLDPSLLRGANAASTMFDQTSQGQLSTVQPDTKNPMNPMNARAGTATRDPTKIPDELKGATPGDIADGRAMAEKLFVGSNGQMAPAEASRLAILYTQQKRNTKAGPDGKKAGVYSDPTTGDMHIWNPKMKKWEVGKLPLVGANGTGPATMGITSSDLDPVAQAELARNSGGSGGGAISSPDSMDTPDMEDQKFPES